MGYLTIFMRLSGDKIGEFLSSEPTVTDHLRAEIGARLEAIGSAAEFVGKKFFDLVSLRDGVRKESGEVILQGAGDGPLGLLITRLIAWSGEGEEPVSVRTEGDDETEDFGSESE